LHHRQTGRRGRAGSSVTPHIEVARDDERAGIASTGLGNSSILTSMWCGVIRRTAPVAKRSGTAAHPWSMQAEREAVEPGVASFDASIGFDAFFQEHHDGLFKALSLITGDRQDSEDLMQDAFVKLWERWDQIERIDDPSAYLFRVALNGLRVQRRRAAVAMRKWWPASEERDLFRESEIRADLRQRLVELTPRQRAALVLIELLGYGSEHAARILRIRPSTVRALATQGRKALRAREEAADV
jgi:RNA polymerase sigma factor (sigma-70 family)